MSNLKSKLKNNEKTIGGWITLAHPAIAEIFAQAKFDWIVVDMEHSTLTIREVEELIRVVELSGVTPLVRITNNDPNLIKRVMDAGAHGLLVPMVKSVDDIIQAYKAMTYPTDGFRGVGLARAHRYGESFDSYLDKSKKDLILVPQIEHIEAVQNLKEIMSCDEVDAMILGPYDLSGSMGIPGEFDNPKLKNSIQEAVSITKSLNKPCGIHIIENDLQQLVDRDKEGMNFLAYSIDIRILASAVQAGVKKFRELN